MPPPFTQGRRWQSAFFTKEALAERFFHMGGKHRLRGDVANVSHKMVGVGAFDDPRKLRNDVAPCGAVMLLAQ